MFSYLAKLFKSFFKSSTKKKKSKCMSKPKKATHKKPLKKVHKKMKGGYDFSPILQIGNKVANIHNKVPRK